jgi:hypothetical protein
MHALNICELQPHPASVAEAQIETQITKKILQTIKTHDIRKWNTKIESMVMKKMLPDLVEKFSSHNQAEGYIKKSFERAVKHIKVLCNDKQALNKNGQVNVLRIIQNCIQTKAINSTTQAYEHALNEAKSLAAFFVQEDQNEQVEHKVAKAIFSIEQHSCLQKGPKCLFEKTDLLDNLILQQQLELFCSYQSYTYAQVCDHVLQSLQHLETIANTPHLPFAIAALHAKELSRSIDLKKKIGKQNIETIQRIILDQIQTNSSLQPNDLFQRINFLVHISVNYDDLDLLIKASQDYIRSLSNNRYKPSFCYLGEQVYTFINEQIKKIKHHRPLVTLEEILQEITLMFSFVKKIKLAKTTPNGLIEILLFASFADHLPLIQNLSNKSIYAIRHQLSQVAISNKDSNFFDVVRLTYEKIARYKNIQLPQKADYSLFQQDSISDKITHFASQNELIIDTLKPANDNPLYKLVKKTLPQISPEPVEQKTQDKLLEKLFREFPLLSGYRAFYERQIIFYQKILWYQTNKKVQKTPFEKFYLWHYSSLKTEYPTLNGKDLIKKMEEFTMQSLPLMPSYKLYA